MLEEVLAGLAMTGATTVVAAIATSAWDSTRHAVVQLFAYDQGRQAAVIAAQLDGDAALVAQDPDTPTVPARTSSRLGTGGWQTSCAGTPTSTRSFKPSLTPFGLSCPNLDSSGCRTSPPVTTVMPTGSRAET
ncbi:hypothetical protein [Streptomyces sp. YIM S03343]